MTERGPTGSVTERITGKTVAEIVEFLKAHEALFERGDTAVVAVTREDAPDKGAWDLSSERVGKARKYLLSDFKYAYNIRLNAEDSLTVLGEVDQYISGGSSSGARDGSRADTEVPPDGGAEEEGGTPKDYDRSGGEDGVPGDESEEDSDPEGEGSKAYETAKEWWEKWNAWKERRRNTPREPWWKPYTDFVTGKDRQGGGGAGEPPVGGGTPGAGETPDDDNGTPMGDFSRDQDERRRQPNGGWRDNEERVADNRRLHEATIEDVLNREDITPEDLISKIEEYSFDDLKRAEIAGKYGANVFGRFKALLNGEFDNYNFKKGIFDDKKNGTWIEAGRRTARLVFNKKTIVSAAVAGTLGILTGGVGIIGSSIVLGSVAGRGIGEIREMYKGETGNSRKELLLAERSRWSTMQDLALFIRRKENPEGDWIAMQQIQGQIDLAVANGAPEQEIALLQQRLENAKIPDRELADRVKEYLLTIYHDSSESTAISEFDKRMRLESVSDTDRPDRYGYKHGDSVEKRKTFDEKVSHYENATRKLQAWGALVGGIGGVSQNILSGVFDHINLDFKNWLSSGNGQDVWHKVVAQDGQWHYLHNSQAELSSVEDFASSHNLDWLTRSANNSVAKLGDFGMYGGGGMPAMPTNIGGYDISPDMANYLHTSKYAATAIVERALPVLMAAWLFDKHSGKSKIKTENKDEGQAGVGDNSDKKEAKNDQADPVYKKHVRSSKEYLQGLAAELNLDLPVAPSELKPDWYKQGLSQAEVRKLVNTKLQFWTSRFENSDGQKFKVFVCDVMPEINRMVVAQFVWENNGEEVPATDFEDSPGKVMKLAWHTVKIDQFLKSYTDPTIGTIGSKRPDGKTEGGPRNQDGGGGGPEEKVDEAELHAAIEQIKEQVEKNRFDDEVGNKKLDRVYAQAAWFVFQEYVEAFNELDDELKATLNVSFQSLAGDGVINHAVITDTSDIDKSHSLTFTPLTKGNLQIISTFSAGGEVKKGKQTKMFNVLMRLRELKRELVDAANSESDDKKGDPLDD